MFNFMCHLDYATGSPDYMLFLGVSVGMFLDEISI